MAPYNLPGLFLGRMASLGHEESDARNYANWSVDYLKVSIHLVNHRTKAIGKSHMMSSMTIAISETGFPPKSDTSAWEMP